jgi:glycosyltransferase involved in cell wall biosynthesis
MRILVLASTFPRWPGDTTPPFVHRLSVGLLQRGHEIYVLAPHEAGAAFSEVMDGLHVHRFRYAPAGAESLAYGGGILENLRRDPMRWRQVPLFLSAQFVAMARVVMGEHIDAIHAHWAIPQGLVAAVGHPVLNRPVVLTAHGADVMAMTTGLRRRLLRLAAREATACTAVSSVLQRELKSVAGVDAAVIPMGVDTAVFVGANRHRRPRRPQVLFVGRLAEKKGVRYLINAWPLVQTSHPNAKLVIVGDGPERKGLEDLANGLRLTDAVEFVGGLPNDELPAYYAAADVLVAPSIVSRSGDTEGLPVVILEAAASGTPIVASNVGGIADAIEHERTGLLVEPASPAAIADAIKRLLDDRRLCTALVRGARRAVVERYSWDVVADQYDALFRSLPVRR